ncbi:MAG: hypothetical protein ACT6XY_03800 [Phreatobacter sp.]|uniref:hypothetical protein n=1 Tax=Phreatobacter sp. TaxID=1966341 RepID=UPI004035EE05
MSALKAIESDFDRADSGRRPVLKRHLRIQTNLRLLSHEEKMEIARGIMRRDRAILAELAK